MRIYFASYLSVMLNKGGPSYVILQLEKELKKLGIEVCLFDMWNQNINFKQDDLVHLVNASISTYSFARNLKNYGTKYVINPIFFSNHSAKTLRLYQMLEKPFTGIFKRSYSDYDLTKYICEHSEKILPNTCAEADLLAEGLNLREDKIEVIPNGVEERFLDADPSLFQKEYGIKDFVLYVGHIGSVRKNSLKIVKALQKLDHPAVIIANILQNKLGERCFAEIKKSKNITYLGWLEHSDPLLESAYAACKTFILPTRYETPGIAAMEAGLTGANVVITPFGGTKDYFEDMVEYVNPHSVESIKQGIEKALNKNQNDKLRNHIKEKFLWKIIAKTTLKMYKEVLEV